MRKELIGYLNTLVWKDRQYFQEPFGIEISGVQYSGVSDGCRVLLLRAQDVTRKLPDSASGAIVGWVSESAPRPKETLQLQDLKQWCCPQEAPAGWVDEESGESGPDFAHNNGSLLGVALDRQKLWELIAPLPGESVLVTRPLRDDKTPFVFETDEWIALLMPLRSSEDGLYPEYSP